VEDAIRTFALSLGVDDIGFADVLAYNSPQSSEITTLLPNAKSIIVLAFRVLSSCESPSWTAALNGYIDLGSFARTASYRLARHLEAQYGAKVANIPLTYPFEIRYDRRGVADFSHRHAAIAAGLGVLGRHNLVIHPRFGTPYRRPGRRPAPVSPADKASAFPLAGKAAAFHSALGRDLLPPSLLGYVAL
jgi:epoxyqueuosine reductase